MWMLGRNFDHQQVRGLGRGKGLLLLQNNFNLWIGVKHAIQLLLYSTHSNQNDDGQDGWPRWMAGRQELVLAPVSSAHFTLALWRIEGDRRLGKCRGKIHTEIIHKLTVATKNCRNQPTEPTGQTISPGHHPHLRVRTPQSVICSLVESWVLLMVTAIGKSAICICLLLPLRGVEE